jgi:hypothetical protein
MRGLAEAGATTAECGARHGVAAGQMLTARVVARHALNLSARSPAGRFRMKVYRNADNR